MTEQNEKKAVTLKLTQEELLTILERVKKRYNLEDNTNYNIDELIKDELETIINIYSISAKLAQPALDEIYKLQQSIKD